MSTQAFNQIETWDGKKIKAALAQAKNDEALQQAIAERYMPILEHIGAKDLSALTTVAKKLTTKKPLERDWQPDATSIEVLGSIPVEKIILQKAKKFPEWLTYLGRLTELSLKECKKMSLRRCIRRAGLVGCIKPLPRSPLSFKRMARVKEGDFADWREVPSA